MAFGIDDIISTGLKIIDKFIPDPQAKLKAQQELMAMQHDELVAVLGAESEAIKGQLRANENEALSRSVFVAGWRPFIGWVCGLSFAWHFVVSPIVLFAAEFYGKSIPVPVFDMNSLMTVLMGMLGLGGMRTYEKMKGLTK